MNRHQRFYAQLFPKRAPNWVLKALLPHEFKHLSDVKKKCDYCEGHRKKGEEIKWYPRVVLRRLPGGLMQCNQHGTAVQRQVRAMQHLTNVKIVMDKSPSTEEMSSR